MLPSTSGGHDPISAARGRDRCFLPGLVLGWGGVQRLGRRPPREKGAPKHGGALQPASSRGGRIHSFAYSHTGPGGSQAEVRVGTWEPEARTRHADSGLELEPEGRSGSYRQQRRRGPPSRTLSTRAHASPRSPLQPDRGDSTPPRPLVPPGLPPCGRLPRWGPAAGSPATAPGAGSAWGRGHTGRGHGRGGAGPEAGWGGKRWPELGPPGPASCPVLQPGLSRTNKCTCPPTPTGRARAGCLVCSAARCSGRLLSEHLLSTGSCSTRSVSFALRTPQAGVTFLRAGETEFRGRSWPNKVNHQPAL